jgi:hypothetical protein
MGGVHLGDKAVIGIVSSRTGSGYWMVATHAIVPPTTTVAHDDADGADDDATETARRASRRVLRPGRRLRLHGGRRLDGVFAHERERCSIFGRSRALACRVMGVRARHGLKACLAAARPVVRRVAPVERLHSWPAAP